MDQAAQLGARSAIMQPLKNCGLAKRLGEPSGLSVAVPRQSTSALCTNCTFPELLPQTSINTHSKPFAAHERAGERARGLVWRQY